MPELSTGLVIAGAYADKLRRTLFAQLRDYIKQGKISPEEVAAAASEINRLLYDIIVNKLRLGKGDAVRIRVDYALEATPGRVRVKWLLETLRVEAWRRMPQDEVEKAVREAVGRTR